MIKGIIFDLDGTLVQIPISYNIIREKLQELFDTTDKFQPLIPTILKNAEGNQKLIDQSFDLICDEEMLATDNFIVIENAIDVLNYFKNKDYPLSLVTMQCMKAATKILEKMQIFDLFSSVKTRDQSEQRVIQIKKSIDVLSFSPEEIVVVGDRINDIESAKQVGCSAILSNKNKVHSFDESPVISELSELKNLIS